jgi:hypothetical protein
VLHAGFWGRWMRRRQGDAAEVPCSRVNLAHVCAYMATMLSRVCWQSWVAPVTAAPLLPPLSRRPLLSCALLALHPPSPPANLLPCTPLPGGTCPKGQLCAVDGSSCVPETLSPITAAISCADVECGSVPTGDGNAFTCPGTCSAGQKCVDNKCTDSECQHHPVAQRGASWQWELPHTT